MPLRTYQKATAYAADSVRPGPTMPRPAVVVPVNHFVLQDTYSPPASTQVLSMWEMLGRMYSGLKYMVASSTAAGLILPMLFIIGGLGFIYIQVQPDITEQVKQSVNYYDQGSVSLVQDSYIESNLQFVSNPGADYFAKLSAAAQESGVFNEDAASLDYRGTFYISIPRLGINRLPVQANVESTSKDVYGEVLNSALAHFKGTSLPISKEATTTVIYGHSTGGRYTPRPTDVVSAFTFLPEMQVGDEIILEVEGKEYKYRMRKSDIVKPEDTQILEGTPGKRKLTLFTCWPPGNNRSRYVITALPV